MESIENWVCQVIILSYIDDESERLLESTQCRLRTRHLYDDNLRVPTHIDLFPSVNLSIQSAHAFIFFIIQSNSKHDKSLNLRFTNPDSHFWRSVAEPISFLKET